MKSKELNEILNKTRRTPDISLTPKQVKELIKDLEYYEELKKIMGTPIQEIMKRLKILDILKRKIKVYPNGVIYLEDMPYEECIKIKEWLNGKD